MNEARKERLLQEILDLLDEVTDSTYTSDIDITDDEIAEILAY